MEIALAPPRRHAATPSAVMNSRHRMCGLGEAYRGQESIGTGLKHVIRRGKLRAD
jgi:hypothetical protein